MPKLAFKVIDNLDEAKFYWEKFSPNISIYDSWDFRYCFYKYYNFPLRFYVAIVEDKPIGLMALQFNKEKNYLDFFGDSHGFMEDNRVFVIPGYESFIPNFYENIMEAANLEYIVGEDEFTKNLAIQDYKYILNLDLYQNYEDYLAKEFSSKSRANLRKKDRELENFGIQVIENQFEDIEFMMNYNIKRFGEESSFIYPYRKEIYRDFLKLPYLPIVMTFFLKNEKQGSSLALLYKDTYVYFNAGANLELYPNLGTYIVLSNIKKGIELGAKIFDSGVVAYNIKERLHMTKIPQYQYKHSI